MFRKASTIALAIVLSGCVHLTGDFMKASDYERAIILYENGFFKEARVLADSIGKESPDHKAARRLVSDIDSMMLKVAGRHMEIGEDYEKAGLLPMALREYRTSLALNPNNPFLRKKVVTLGEAIREGQRGEIEKRVNRIPPKPQEPKKEDPEEIANNHYLRGKVYLESRVYGRAIEEFDSALRIMPTYMDTRQLLARARRELAREVDYHMKRGIAFFQKEEMELAIKEWDSVLDLDPGNMTAADYKARAEVIMQRLQSIKERQSEHSTL